MVYAQLTANTMIKTYFGTIGTLISTPNYTVTPDKVVIQLFSYNGVASHSNKGLKLNTKSFNPIITSNGLSSLVSALSYLFTENIKDTNVTKAQVQLRVVRLHHPYLNSNILAQFLAINASKYGFTRLRHYVLSAIPLTKVANLTTSSVIVGVKVQVSGLLTTQRNAPRKTVSTLSVGTFHGTNAKMQLSGSNSQAPINTNVEYSSHTSKSTLGSYTVKV